MPSRFHPMSDILINSHKMLEMTQLDVLFLQVTNVRPRKRTLKAHGYSGRIEPRFQLCLLILNFFLLRVMPHSLTKNTEVFIFNSQLCNIILLVTSIKISMDVLQVNPMFEMLLSLSNSSEQVLPQRF